MAYRYMWPKYQNNIYKKHFLLNELKWTGNSKQREYNDVCWILFCTTDTEILPIQ